MWVCPDCGEELSDKEVTFCGACGSRISTAEEVNLSQLDGGIEAPSKYWSDEENADDEDDEDEEEAEAPAKYWSDEAADEEFDDEIGDGEDNVDEEQPDANMVPEDLSALTEKLDAMVQNFTDSEAKELVILKRFTSQEEALMVKGMLDCESIPSMNSYNILYVRQDDLENAREIIGSV